MATIGELKVVYSGGASNTDQQLSIGGAISTASQAAVRSQLASPPSPAIAGLTILDARGHASYGTGALRWTHTTNALSWKRPGGVTFAGSVFSTDGVYAIGDSGGYLIVQIVIANMPASSFDSSVDITPAINKTFDNISPTQSLLGYVDYRCFYLRNTATVGSAVDAKMWIKKQPDGEDTLSIALDPSGINGTALQLIDEEDSTTVLSGLTWSAPSTQSAGLLLGTLAAGDYRAFWVRRTVPVDTYTQVIEDRSAIAFSALV